MTGQHELASFIFKKGNKNSFGREIWSSSLILLIFSCSLAQCCVAFSPGHMQLPSTRGISTFAYPSEDMSTNPNSKYSKFPGNKKLSSSRNRIPVISRNGHLVSRTSLQMSVAPFSAAGVAAAFSALSGGLFSGSLHAISGPDHLAAVIPKCCGQRWYKAGRIGVLWGIGHGVSATLVGIAAFALKNRLPEKMGGFLHGASSTMEIAIGFSLILIGFLGIRESREWQEEIDAGTQQSLSAAAAPDAGVRTQTKRAVIFNGILHGFSFDGAPSLAPVLAVAKWRGSLTFLFAHALGTIASMAFVTVAIGEGTRRAGQILHRPDVPQKVSFVSSWVAVAVGLFWIRLAFV